MQAGLQTSPVMTPRTIATVERAERLDGDRCLDVALRTAILSPVGAVAGKKFAFSLLAEEGGVNMALSASSEASANHWAQRLRDAILRSTDEQCLVKQRDAAAATALQAAWRGLSNRRASGGHKCSQPQGQ